MKIETNDTNYRVFYGKYFVAAFAMVCVAYAAGILVPEIFFREPLTGSLIVWTHLHTMGIVSPIFFGLGFYLLKERYGVIFKPAIIYIQLLWLYISLGFFLFFVSNREGSPGLTISALLLFFSVSFYIYLYARVLYRHGRASKENRDFEFWMDAASLYFLFQAVFFGFILATNLSYHFFRRSEIHSLRLHSHSGITGFWLLQTINLVYRFSKQMIVKQAKPQSDTMDSRLRILKYSAYAVIAGLFLWTSVHDRFGGLIYLYFILMGTAILFLALHIKNFIYETEGMRAVLLSMAIFMIISWILGGYMIFSTSETQMYEYHIPFIYLFLIVYGIFLSVPLYYLTGKNRNSPGDVSLLWRSIRWSWALSVFPLVVFIASVSVENVLFVRISLVAMAGGFVSLLFRLFRFRSMF